MTQNPILTDLEELQANCPANIPVTRSWSEAGRLLALCEGCPEFTPREGCSIEGQTPALFAAFLCDASRYCERWLKMIATEP